MRAAHELAEDDEAAALPPARCGFDGAAAVAAAAAGFDGERRGFRACAAGCLRLEEDAAGSKSESTSSSSPSSSSSSSSSAPDGTYSSSPSSSLSSFLERRCFLGLLALVRASERGVCFVRGGCPSKTPSSSASSHGTHGDVLFAALEPRRAARGTWSSASASASHRPSWKLGFVQPGDPHSFLGLGIGLGSLKAYCRAQCCGAMPAGARREDSR